MRTLSKEQIAEKDRLCMARLMILHGFYDKAYEWLAGQCFCKLEPAELMRLCSRLLAKESHLEEKRLMLLCAQAALNGKYERSDFTVSGGCLRGKLQRAGSAVAGGKKILKSTSGKSTGSS